MRGASPNWWALMMVAVMLPAVWAIRPAWSQPSAMQWIDAKTGQKVPDSAVIPVGTRLDPDGKHAVRSSTTNVPGATYFRDPNGGWTDSKTGKPVPESAQIPIGTKLDPLDTNHAVRASTTNVPGATYVRVPIPPPVPPPAAKPLLPVVPTIIYEGPK